MSKRRVAIQLFSNEKKTARLNLPKPVHPFSLFWTDQNVSSDLHRQNAYAYGSWQVFDPFRLLAGVSYDHATFPNNVDLPPLTTGDSSRDLVVPKAGLFFEP